jgi:predicted nucleic-acid-binding protein
LIAVDTNVLLRLVVADNEQQNKRAAAFFAERSPADPAYISEMTLAEFVWVLRSSYKYDRDSLVSVLTHLLATEDAAVCQGRDIRLC